LPPELRRVIEFLNERMSPTEVLGVEIRQYLGEGELRTLVPVVVCQTEQARIQKVGSGRAPSVDVDWDYYEDRLEPDRFAVVRRLFDRLEKTIGERGLGWTPRLKRDYFGFQRSGGYHCVRSRCLSPSCRVLDQAPAGAR